MSRHSSTRPDDGRGAVGPFFPGRRWAMSNLGAMALVGGLFWPWRHISYSSAGRISDGVLDLPGGVAYAVLLAACLIGAVCGGVHRRPIRGALMVMGVGLAGYSAFWLLGGLALDLESGFSLAHPQFGAGVLLSFVGSVLTVRTVGASMRLTPMGSLEGPGEDVILGDEAEDGSGGLASCEEFTERLQVLSTGGAGPETVPLVFVRLDGLEEVHRRHGSRAADRIWAAIAHRLRAQLRQGDTAVSLAPGEVFILLSGRASEQNAMVVVSRLESALAKPVPSVKPRHADLVKVTAGIAGARLTNGRLQVVVDGDCLVDAPVVPLESHSQPPPG
jgi:GGDEF domain-containing protein